MGSSEHDDDIRQSGKRNDFERNAEPVSIRHGRARRVPSLVAVHHRRVCRQEARETAFESSAKQVMLGRQLEQLERLKISSHRHTLAENGPL